MQKRFLFVLTRNSRSTDFVKRISILSFDRQAYSYLAPNKKNQFLDVKNVLFAKYMGCNFFVHWPNMPGGPYYSCTST